MPNLDNNPSNGVGGSSYIYDYGTSAQTRTAVSQKVRLKTPHYGENSATHQLGVVSSFSLSESKGVDPVRGIGFGDEVAELVPGVTEPASASLERALLWECNLWQGTGYASGIDGPVRSLKHHRWPFDLEMQKVFSTLADADLGVANTGYNGAAGSFDGGVRRIEYPQVTPDFGPGGNGISSSGGHGVAPNEARGHSAILTMLEACWWTSWSEGLDASSGIIMESGDIMISDIHDFSSMYGEFLASGNDPTIGQLGSIRFGEVNNAFRTAQVGAGITGGSPISEFVNV